MSDIFGFGDDPNLVLDADFSCLCTRDLDLRGLVLDLTLRGLVLDLTLRDFVLDLTLRGDLDLRTIYFKL